MSFEKTYKNILFCLLVLYISITIITLSVGQKTKYKKNTNPYKTKEKLEQEEEFQAPELLDTKELNDLREKIQEEKDENDEEDEIKDTLVHNNHNNEDEDDLEENQTKTEILDNSFVKHSDELEIEALERKNYFLFMFSVYEVIMIGFVILFVLNCLIGKSKNDNLADKWLSDNKNFFLKQYAHVGTELQSSSDVALTKESWNNYKFYGSGRINLNSNLISLDLSKRQDLLAMATGIFFPAEKDRVIYDFSVNIQDTPLVFCFCRKKDIKYMKKNYTDIDFLTQNYSTSFLGNDKTLILMTEDEELINRLFDMNLIRLYEKVAKYIDIIYFTDRQTYSKDNNNLFCSFYVADMEKSLEITNFVHLLLDKLASLEISSKKKAAAQKLRLEYDEHLEKEKLKKIKGSEEEYERLNNEAQKKQEKIEMMKKNMTNEQLMKYEEKEKKKQMKKQIGKQMKVMKQ
jgi:hypothetical protein